MKSQYHFNYRNNLLVLLKHFLVTFQVCKPALQAFGELYLILGKSMEMDIDKVATLLLTKSADTNRFLRYLLNLFACVDIIEH